MVEVRRSDWLSHQQAFQSRCHLSNASAYVAFPMPFKSQFASQKLLVWTDSMHVIVVGCGRVGSGLALALSSNGHSVSLIDKSARAFRRVDPAFTGTQFVGLGFDRDTLLEAGAERCDAFAAVTSGDNSNILSARIAKENFQIGSVVARIYDPKRAEIYQRLGISTVATVAWTTEQVMHRLLPGRPPIWTDQSGSLRLIERNLPMPWAGHRLDNLSDGDRHRLVAVSRAGRARLVSPDIIGQEGDVLHVLVNSDAASHFDALLAGAPIGGHA